MLIVLLSILANSHCFTRVHKLQLGCIDLLLLLVGMYAVKYCKVDGSNLTCRDDWKTRWRLHSVDLTSTGLSSPGQSIIHSPVARVVYG